MIMALISYKPDNALSVYSPDSPPRWQTDRLPGSKSREQQTQQQQ